MGPSTTKWNERGSEWNRWDPHIHAPGTVLEDQFGNDWDGYLKKIEDSNPPIRALGITDYYSIESYRTVRAWKEKSRLPEADFIFPNVEMRLDIKTAKQKGINIHLLFSPDDPNHEKEIERLLSHLEFDFKGRKYRCSRQELIDLGKAFDSKQTDDVGAFREGVKQFKVDFNQLRTLFKDEAWLRENCLVAVASGMDGTAGLKNDDGFAAQRGEIERFAHIILSGSPNDREYWLGKKTGMDRAAIEKKYYSLKPCLHGCDAHRLESVGQPDEKRYCWMKGDLAFETLRQAMIEPEERIWVGEESPVIESTTISVLQTINAPWLKNPEVQFNSGLVSIIGARGSGKTALVDLIAAGAHALGNELTASSFLRRATKPIDLIGDASVKEIWADGSVSEADFRPPEELFEEVGAEVRYLSQNFVDQLCSSAGLATELRKEIERVIFEQTKPTERFETDSFETLSDLLLQPILHRRAIQRNLIHSIGQKIAEEEKLRDTLPKLKVDRTALDMQITKAKKELAALLPKGKEERAKRLLALEEACKTLESKVENIARRKNNLDDLLAETKIITDQTEPERLSAMKEQFIEAGLNDPQWEAFRLKFSGDVAATIAATKKLADKELSKVINGDTANPIDSSKAVLTDWPLTTLQAERDTVKKEVGIDAAKQQRYETLQKSLTTNHATLNRLDVSIKNAEGAEARRTELIQARRSAYKEVFETFTEERDKLKNLYEPLEEQIKGAKGALGKLSFVVRREIDFDQWVDDGEKLFDLRRETRLRGQGALKKEANQLFLSWLAGTPSEVATTMHDFVEGLKRDFLGAMPPSITPATKLDWLRQVGEWLYSADHVTIRYAVQYNGVAIEQLSPGTRGIVLLLLYLAIDKTDRRPLLIDQPEENLDPQSVFDDLVPHFREARKRRQVIIVTHNANMVVNTDADQVIVASCEPSQPDKLPVIEYQSGSLENPLIRTKVCEILEGGKRAFLERERRYRLEWEKLLDEGVAPSA
jgi:energy-coupling factor transporter ATP-binding protein EcfA2